MYGVQVLVMFQPHDVGSFSQIWDLQVCIVHTTTYIHSTCVSV